MIVRGIQRNIVNLFSNAEYEMLNSQAQAIFATIGTDDDAQTWPLIRADETMSMLADKVFIRMLLRFRQFNQQRQSFTALIVSSIEANAYKFTDQDFCEIFEVIFGRYDKMIKTPEGRTKMDVYYGDGTADGIIQHLLRLRAVQEGHDRAGGPHQGNAVRRAAVTRRLDSVTRC